MEPAPNGGRARPAGYPTRRLAGYPGRVDQEPEHAVTDESGVPLSAAFDAARAVAQLLVDPRANLLSRVQADIDAREQEVVREMAHGG